MVKHTLKLMCNTNIWFTPYKGGNWKLMHNTKIPEDGFKSFFKDNKQFYPGQHSVGDKSYTSCKYNA